MPAVSTDHRNTAFLRVIRDVVVVVRSVLSPVEVDGVWRRWRSGQAVKVLAREMRRYPSTVRDLLKRSGGVRPVPRRRWELRLLLAEREEISRGVAAELSFRTIATRLGRGSVHAEVSLHHWQQVLDRIVKRPR